MLRFPELRGPGFAKRIESAGSNHPLHFFRRRHDTTIEIRQRGELLVLALGYNAIFSMLSQSFDASEWDSNRFTLDREHRSGLIDKRRQQRDVEPVTFEHVNQRVIKPFSIGENCGHKLGRIIALEPCALVSLHSISS